jgi:hypothetical protein
MAIDFTCAKRPKLAKLGPKIRIKDGQNSKKSPKLDNKVKRAETGKAKQGKQGQMAKLDLNCQNKV